MFTSLCLCCFYSVFYIKYAVAKVQIISETAKIIFRYNVTKKVEAAHYRRLLKKPIYTLRLF